jgi:predicted ATP-dependent protease
MMNAYFAEITAHERMAEFHRDAAHSRLIREARRGTGARSAARSHRASKVVAAASFAVTLWMAIFP